MVRRRRRRLPVGQGRARHEVAGGGRDRRGGVAGALGLASGARRAVDRGGRRRGDGRLARARNGSPRTIRRRSAATCSSTRAAAGCSRYGGRPRCYGVCCAEKGVFRFKVITDGVAGHASMPGMGENALLKMGPVLERLRRASRSYRADGGAARVPARDRRGRGGPRGLDRAPARGRSAPRDDVRADARRDVHADADPAPRRRST